MKTSRLFTSLSFSLVSASLISAGSVPISMGICPTPAIAASKSKSEASYAVTQLDAKALQMANKGNWSGFVDYLQNRTQDQSMPTMSYAWLAFGLMFLDRQADLATLAQKIKAMPANDAEPFAQKLVEVFNLITQRKYDEAKQIVGTIKDADKNVLADLAMAALSAKTGDTAKAIEYCQKTITLAPDFAWGYRTIGFLQDRVLKSPDEAEATYEKTLQLQPQFKEVRDLLVDLRTARNDFDGAIDTAQIAIRENPQDPVNYYRLSQILTRQWRLKEAEAQLDKAIRLAPDNARYHRAKASIMRFQRRMADAVTEQQKAVSLSSDKSFELTELAALNELAGNDSAAADNLKEALTLAPVNQAAYQSAHQKLVQLLTRGKRWEDIVSEYKRALQLQPENTTLRIGLADALVQTGKQADAMKELEAAANTDQRDPRPHRMVGALLMQKKDYSAAAKAYTRALNINPTSVDDLVALGYTYALNDDYMAAETAFVTALALQQLTNSNGNKSMVMRSFATLLLSEGRYNEAALNYEEVARDLKNGPTEKQDAFLLAQAKALRDRKNADIQAMLASFADLPDSEKVLARSACVDSLLKLGKASEALEELGKAAPEIKSSQQWLTLESRAYQIKGDLNKAEEIANKAISTKDESNENTSDAYIQKAQVLMQKGDLVGAEAALHKATDLNGKSFAAYEILGRVFLKKKEFDHALDASKRALEINPYHTAAYVLNGDVYLATNKDGDSLTNYKRAVELYPSLVETHKSLRDAYKKLANKAGVEQEDSTIAQLEGCQIAK